MGHEFDPYGRCQTVSADLDASPMITYDHWWYQTTQKYREILIGFIYFYILDALRLEKAFGFLSSFWRPELLVCCTLLGCDVVKPEKPLPNSPEMARKTIPKRWLHDWMSNGGANSQHPVGSSSFSPSNFYLSGLMEMHGKCGQK